MGQPQWVLLERRRRVAREHRAARCSKLVPVLRAYCRRVDVTMRRVEHGYQFLRNEYVITWSPTTNKIQISYTLPGDGKTIPFEAIASKKPKIFQALEELIRLVRSACP